MKINVATDILSLAGKSATCRRDVRSYNELENVQLADGTSAATMNWKVYVHRNY